jgi:hypothetical protein
MIAWIKQIFPSNRPSTLHDEMCGRELTGLYINQSAARFRFSDGKALLVSLETRNFLGSPAKLWREWLTFPGWLRVTGVKETPDKITLTVSGTIYSANIILRDAGDNGWEMSFGGGQIF